MMRNPSRLGRQLIPRAVSSNASYWRGLNFQRLAPISPHRFLIFREFAVVLLFSCPRIPRPNHTVSNETEVELRPRKYETYYLNYSTLSLLYAYVCSL
jgi:hypothetical protein